MIKKEELAQIYAEEKIESIKTLLKQAYMDGYEAGLENNHFEIRIGETKYFDLGLPSGTLWSFPPQKFDYGWHLDCRSFEEVKDLNLPTEEQWNELCAHSRIYAHKIIGPSGQHVGYPVCDNTSTFYLVKTLGENCQKGHNKFWLKTEPDEKHMVKVIEFDDNHKGLSTHFTGYHLPFFLVKNKEEI